jgi:hypothetical protein
VALHVPDLIISRPVSRIINNEFFWYAHQAFRCRLYFVLSIATLESTLDFRRHLRVEL